MLPTDELETDVVFVGQRIFKMQVFLPSNEAARVKALDRYEFLDATPTHELDDLTFLAAQICQTPAAFITFVDAEHQWTKSKFGELAMALAGELAFCKHTIQQPDLLLVPDAQADERFATNPSVMGEPYIRFYAGVPLVTPDGYALGALCVMDRVHRDLNEAQQQALRALGRQVVNQLELYRHRAERQQMELALQESRERLRALVEDVNIIPWEADPVTENYTYMGPQVVETLGYSLKEWYRDGFWVQHIHPEDREQAIHFSREAVIHCDHYEFEYRMLAADGRIVWLRDMVNVMRDEARPVPAAWVRPQHYRTQAGRGRTPYHP